jgi:hypothetical protein
VLALVEIDLGVGLQKIDHETVEQKMKNFEIIRQTLFDVLVVVKANGTMMTMEVSFWFFCI